MTHKDQTHKEAREARDEFTQQLGSTRVGSVWSRGSTTPEGVAKLMQHRVSADVQHAGLSPGRVGMLEGSAAKRAEAAAYLSKVTGQLIPAHTDVAFRAALRDGKVLCFVVNQLRPNAIKVADIAEVGTKERYENVQSFIRACNEVLKVPIESMCSMADLDYDGLDERPRVTDCVLCLMKLHENVTPTPRQTQLGNDLRMVDSKPDQSGRHQPWPGATVMPGALPASSSMALQAVNGSPPNGQVLVHPGIGPGVGRLAMQCSAIMQQRTTYTSHITTTVQATGAQVKPGEISEAMQAHLQHMIGKLSADYEARTLEKDRHINKVQDKLDHAMKELGSLQTQLQEAVDQIQAGANNRAAEADSARVLELEQQVEKLTAELAEAHQEIENLQRQGMEAVQRLLGQGNQAQEELEAVQAQLADAHQELEAKQGLEAKCMAYKEENWRLYNEVQDMKGSVRVFCRIRPAGRTNDHSTVCVSRMDESDVVIEGGPRGEPIPFKFNKVFGPEATQAEVYADAQSLIRSVMDGYNVCIFAYGQTGSGKTHTMSGTNVRQEEGRGINFRALGDLFNLQAARQHEVLYTFRVQMVEIYNDSLRDLLLEPGSAPAIKLDINSTQASGQNVPGATQEEVTCSEDILNLMEKGARNRHSAETKMNERSSRSHQVLTVIVDGEHRESGAKTHACLHLIDLAGSERTSKSEATGERMVEANAINTSLSALTAVMKALAEKSKHIPFRNSKLTQLLADSLSGQAKVMMFVHVAPESSSYQESVSTLRFSQMVCDITLGQAKKNVDSQALVSSQKELAALRGKTSSQDQLIQQLQRQLRDAQEREARLEKQLKQQTAQAAAYAGSPTGSGSTSYQTANPASFTPLSGMQPASHFARMLDATDQSLTSAGSTASAMRTPAGPVSAWARTAAPASLSGRITEPQQSAQQLASVAALARVSGDSINLQPVTEGPAASGSRTQRGSYLPAGPGLPSARKYPAVGMSASSGSMRLGSASERRTQLSGTQRPGYATTGGAPTGVAVTPESRPSMAPPASARQAKAGVYSASRPSQGNNTGRFRM